MISLINDAEIKILKVKQEHPDNYTIICATETPLPLECQILYGYFGRYRSSLCVTDCLKDVKLDLNKNFFFSNGLYGMTPSFVKSQQGRLLLIGYPGATIPPDKNSIWYHPTINLTLVKTMAEDYFTSQ